MKDPIVKLALLFLIGILILTVAVPLSIKIANIDGTVLNQIKDMAGFFQAVATIAAIAVGGIYAYRNNLILRRFEPHLTISHEVSHRPIGSQYVHIAVTATLYNGSRVRVEVRHGYFELLQIAPMDDDDVEYLYGQVFAVQSDGPNIRDFDWTHLDIIHRASDAHPLIIEPGEYHHEPGEFVVSNAVETVLIYSYFYNPVFRQGSQSAPGWTATTVYDMMNPRSDGDDRNP